MRGKRRESIKRDEVGKVRSHRVLGSREQLWFYSGCKEKPLVCLKYRGEWHTLKRSLWLLSGESIVEDWRRSTQTNGKSYRIVLERDDGGLD